MQVRLSFLLGFFSALLLSASPAFSAGGSGPSGEGVSRLCEMAIDKAAGRYSQCLLKANARHAKRGSEARLLAQQTRCENKFDAQVARIEDRFGEDQCTPYVSEIADRTESYTSSVAREARGLRAASVLFVQNGAGGTLSDTTLILSGVGAQTTWFTDRPYRLAGEFSTAEFLSRWDEGEDSFADDPPNADFTCYTEGKIANYVVELTSPSIIGEDLSYSVLAVGEFALPETPITCEAGAQLFIDDSLQPGSCPGLTVLSNSQCVCPASVTPANPDYASCQIDQCQCPTWGPAGKEYICASNCPPGLYN